MLERYLKDNWNQYLGQIAQGGLIAQYIAQYLGIDVQTVMTKAAFILIMGGK